MQHSHSSPVSLLFLPNLSEIEFFGLSFDEHLEKGLDEVDEELLVLLLEGGLDEKWELEFLFKSFLPGFLLLPEFLDSK